ncbi:OmpA family protein [Aureitalea sp. L0-47]|uniref:OmpA family protein n=1 Tax=Aureitalea sp. L0-47 TaxID=2816962 RepID=UPI00223707F4|nr:OmpA family protein [Aureitalea sp. L0-47]MCW5519102.1 OmpA family protein [Aureitalea sp. L0-47]
MYFRFFHIVLILLAANCFAQPEPRFNYTGSDGHRIHLPLGKVSFADSVVAFHMGFPRPLSIFRDSTQALNRPNYKGYKSPDFVSLGCKGSLVLKFNNNGFMDLLGPDLAIFEVGPARERASIEVSEDGMIWYSAGATNGGTSKIDLSNSNIDPNKIFYYVRIRDLKDECAGKSAGADIDAIAAINSVLKISVNADVLFDVDEYKLKSSARKTLDSLVQAIRVVEKGTILIEGHTDNDGEEEYNLELSENRCKSVHKKLEKMLAYVGDYHFEIRAFGESKPRVENNSDENKQINRRVEIMVLPPRDYFESFTEE